MGASALYPCTGAITAPPAAESWSYCWLLSRGHVVTAQYSTGTSSSWVPVVLPAVPCLLGW